MKHFCKLWAASAQKSQSATQPSFGKVSVGPWPFSLLVKMSERHKPKKIAMAIFFSEVQKRLKIGPFFRQFRDPKVSRWDTFEVLRVRFFCWSKNLVVASHLWANNSLRGKFWSSKGLAYVSHFPRPRFLQKSWSRNMRQVCRGPKLAAPRAISFWIKLILLDPSGRVGIMHTDRLRRAVCMIHLGPKISVGFLEQRVSSMRTQKIRLCAFFAILEKSFRDF